MILVSEGRSRINSLRDASETKCVNRKRKPNAMSRTNGGLGVRMQLLNPEISTQETSSQVYLGAGYQCGTL
jgi:hypothetical protein